MNEAADAADQHTLDWLSDQNLLSAQDSDEFRDYRCGWLAARAYPNADFDALCITSDWVGWLCALDHQCDESGVGTRPAQLTRMLARSGEILRDPAAPASGYDSPLEESLRDLLRRMAGRMSEAWMAQFAADVDTFFDALVWEATNRSQGAAPSLAEYLSMRPGSSGVQPCVDLVELAEGFELAPEWRRSPDLRDLLAKATNAVSWANDVLSVEREMKGDDPHNLVLVIRREKGCSLDAAVGAVVALHDEEVRTFIDAQAEFTASAPLGPEIQAWLLGLRSWMRGYLDWTVETSRYLPTP